MRLTRASACIPTSRFKSDDLPTLERPEKAISGMRARGRSSTRTTPLTNDARPPLTAPPSLRGSIAPQNPVSRGELAYRQGAPAVAAQSAVSRSRARVPKTWIFLHHAEQSARREAPQSGRRRSAGALRNASRDERHRIWAARYGHLMRDPGKPLRRQIAGSTRGSKQPVHRCGRRERGAKDFIDVVDEDHLEPTARLQGDLFPIGLVLAR